MKKFLLFLPMVSFPALGHCVLPYLGGRGFIPDSFVLDLAACILLPFPIAAWIAIIAPTSLVLPAPGLKRLAIFVVALVTQIGLLLFTPGSAETEMRGLSERYRREFPAQELREIAAEVRKKSADGTLIFASNSNLASMAWNDAQVLEPSQIPFPIRGKFRSVRLSKREGTGTEVVFEVAPDRGIVCSTNYYGDNFWKCTIDRDVYAYRYMRP